MNRIVCLVAATAAVMLTVGCASQGVRITSTPPGATVTYNGRYVGETPTSLSVNDENVFFHIGKHTFTADKPGYHSDSRIITEVMGKGITDVIPPLIHFDLQPVAAEK